MKVRIYYDEVMQHDYRHAPNELDEDPDGAVYDVPSDTVKRWADAMDAYSKAQEEMAAFYNHSGPEEPVKTQEQMDAEFTTWLHTEYKPPTQDAHHDNEQQPTSASDASQPEHPSTAPKQAE